jgi:hypothetical protein
MSQIRIPDRGAKISLDGSLAVMIEVYEGTGFRISVYEALMDQRGRYSGRIDDYRAQTPLHVYGLDRYSDGPTFKEQVRIIADQCVTVCHQLQMEQQQKENEHEARDAVGSAGLLATPDGEG